MSYDASNRADPHGVIRHAARRRGTTERIVAMVGVESDDGRTIEALDVAARGPRFVVRLSSERGCEVIGECTLKIVGQHVVATMPVNLPVGDGCALDMADATHRLDADNKMFMSGAASGVTAGVRHAWSSVCPLPWYRLRHPFAVRLLRRLVGLHDVWVITDRDPNPKERWWGRG